MSGPNFSIERLSFSASQVQQICKMLGEFWDNDYLEEWITPDHKNMDRHSFVALTNTKEVAGFILVQVPRRNPYIVQFLVSQRFRGQRLGFQILREAIEDIDRYAERMNGRDKYKFVYLDVPTDAEDAIRLYGRNGFEQTAKASKNIGTKSNRLERRIP